MADSQFCSVPREEKGGMLCREPGTIDDPQRGHKVCAEHQRHPVREKLLSGVRSANCYRVPDAHLL
jgi:hypothetical protein